MIEDERKFLLNRPASEIVAEAKAAGQLQNTIEIEQFYYTEGGKTERYRRESDDTYRNRCTITTKHPVDGSDRKRFEYEEETDNDIFEMIASGADTPTVRKTRYEIETERHFIQIDVFGDELEGLEFAEIEAGLQPGYDDDDDDEGGEKLPDWIGEDVTSDPEYRNHNIALKLLEIRRSR